jgi:hypothetical protein
MWEEANLVDARRVFGLYPKEEHSRPYLNMEDVKSKRKSKFLLEDESNDNNGRTQRLLNIFEVSKGGGIVQGRGATTNPAAKWQNCQVPYTISSIFSGSQFHHHSTSGIFIQKCYIQPIFFTFDSHVCLYCQRESRAVCCSFQRYYINN